MVRGIGVRWPDPPPHARSRRPGSAFSSGGKAGGWGVVKGGAWVWLFGDGGEAGSRVSDSSKVTGLGCLEMVPRKAVVGCIGDNGHHR